MKQSATKPKGATSYKETALGIIPHSKLVQMELEGTKNGLEYIHTLVNNNQNTPITPHLICELHKVAFGWIFPTWAGAYRTIQVTFSGKEAPPYHQVSELMINFCKDIEERQKHLPSPHQEEFITQTVSLLAWLQHRFVVIHPFNDYNGRIARMTTTLMLLKLNLPPIELKAETNTDRKRYLTAMHKADHYDSSLLEKLIGQALTEAFEHFSK